MLSLNSNVATLYCHDSDPSVMHPSADVTTLTAIADVATIFTQCCDSDLMSRHSMTNVATLDF